jgi:beta-dihydromenaquinone-9 omega-hydroxylase
MTQSAAALTENRTAMKPVGKFTADLLKVGVDSLAGVVGDTVIERVRRRNGAADPVTRFNPFKRETISNPYPEYEQLLAGPPVRYNPRLGIWIVPRFTDVRAGLRDHERLSSSQSQSRFRVALPMMIAKDPPDHTRLRQLVSRAFTPRALAVWQTLIEQVCDELLDRMLATPEPDGMRDLAKPLPTRIIATMFGIPEADQMKFLTWSEALIDGSFVEVGRRTPNVVAKMARATFAMRQYVRPLVDERRRNPGTDLISMMAQAEDGDVLDDDEIFWGVVMLIVAGNETTTNLLGWLLHTFATRHDIFDELRERPDLIPTAIEEQLRVESPVQGFYRTATVDYPVGDLVIPKGSRAMMLFGAANRDPRHFPDPNTFRLDRGAVDHLALGGGVHFCLGAGLSRMEAGQIIAHLTKRVAAVELAGAPQRLHNATMRGLTHLPLRLVAA